MRSLHGFLGAGLLFAAIAACHSDDVGPIPGPPIRILGNFSKQDTAGEYLELTVELRDPRGYPVWSDPVDLRTDYAPNGVPRLLIAPLRTPNALSPWVIELTNTSGQVPLRVYLGEVAGRARLRISATFQNAEDSVVFNVLPGQVVAARAIPMDTAIETGASFTLRGGGVDSHGNFVPEETNFYANDAGIRVEPLGLVTGVTPGRYTIQAVTRRGVTTTKVTVIPRT